ncbi:unnamed protein product [Rhizoctonia solani]|uniref:Uncharacterized protein n=1 Tax=Rhizoctonia solani TaxID=456999 RepID=A0A8H3HLZ4_9AGAM|nr:unnamed protein product [Rhizoctonia solani]
MDGVYVPLSPESSIDLAQREVLRLFYLTEISAILTFPVMILSWAPLPPHPTAYGAVLLAMTAIIQVVVARPIHISGIRELLFRFTIDVDLLVSLSVGTAYVFSTVACAFSIAEQPIPGTESYFETAVLVTLIMLGRLIASCARRRLTNAIAQLGSIQCTEAILVEKTQEGEQERTRIIPIGLVHVARRLASIALNIALVAFVGWTGVGVQHAYKLMGSERSEGVQRAVVDAIGYMVAIIVVSCTCALALCVPMVAVIAVAVGTRRGVLFKYA